MADESGPTLLDDLPSVWPPQFRHRRPGEPRTAEEITGISNGYGPIYLVTIGYKPVFVTLEEVEAANYVEKFNGRPPMNGPAAEYHPLDWQALRPQEEMCSHCGHCGT